LTTATTTESETAMSNGTDLIERMESRAAAATRDMETEAAAGTTCGAPHRSHARGIISVNANVIDLAKTIMHAQTSARPEKTEVEVSLWPPRMRAAGPKMDAVRLAILVLLFVCAVGVVYLGMEQVKMKRALTPTEPPLPALTQNSTPTGGAHK